MRVRRGYPGGLVAAYADELAREAVFDALWAGRCYGTSGVRILLDFRLNDGVMGQEPTGATDRAARRLWMAIAGTDAIAEIAVVRNGQVVWACRDDRWDPVIEWTDTEPFDDVALVGYDGRPFVYYYVRVLQQDGEAAWSSPVWVTQPQ